MSQPPSTSGRSGLDRIIIGLLITGVMVSVVLEIIGMVLFCHYHGRLSVSSETTSYIHGRDLSFLVYHLSSMIREQGIDIFFMTLGIIVLIMTPFIRVIVSIAYFALERDIKFFLITLFVLAVLLVSILIH